MKINFIQVNQLNTLLFFMTRCKQRVAETSRF